MRTIPLPEYNRIHPDFRGIWTTERDDQPNWARDRHLYMGKRVMMAGDGSCTLLIEGLSFIIDESPDPPMAMRGIRVVFANPRHNIETDINGTRAEIYRYYNRPINVGSSDIDERFETPIAIEFLNPDQTIRLELK